MVDAADVGPLLPQLREVSDAWLGRRQAAEKRFSLGAFDEDYVRRFRWSSPGSRAGRRVRHALGERRAARGQGRPHARVHDAPRT